MCVWVGIAFEYNAMPDRDVRFVNGEETRVGDEDTGDLGDEDVVERY